MKAANFFKQFALPLLIALALCRSSALTPPLFAERISSSILRVEILSSKEPFSVRPTGNCLLTDMTTHDQKPLSLEEHQVSPANPHGIHFGPWMMGDALRLTLSRPQDFIQVNGKRYRGSLLIRLNSDKALSVIAELGLEEYLYGVLATEMSPGWPPEALKAQAVISRTFAIKNLGKHEEDGFDLASDSSSQLYGGVEKEDIRSIAAVSETQGEVLMYKGKLLNAYFHACCGGRTSPIKTAWQSGKKDELKPLMGVSDRYCTASPHYRWSRRFSLEEILSALNRGGLGLERLDSLRINQRDHAGRATSFYVRSGKEGFAVKAGDLRKWLGPNLLKSTYILHLAKTKEGYLFQGRGWGHGIGLCQWGAKAMAESGKDYKQILRHYFPGAQLEEWQE